MVRAILRRLASSLATLGAASLVVFVVLDLLPGSAAAVLLGTAARQDTVAALDRALGLDRSAAWRYAHWVLGALQGDLGVSATYGVPVGGLIAERIAVTAPLAALALGLAVALGVPLGMTAGAHRGGLVDRAASGVAQIGIAVPDFWIGLLLILGLSSGLHWFSAGGFPGWHTPVAALGALVLPAIALALPQAAVLARVSRAAVLEVGHEAFVRTARAKGLAEPAVLWGHMARHALLPVATVVGLQASALVAGAVLVENVFNLPGLGRLATQALAQRDLVVIRSVAMVFAGLVLAVSALVDLAYLWIDPRLRDAA